MEEKIEATDAPAQEKPKMNKKINKKLFGIVGVVILILVLIVGAYFVFAGGSSESDDGGMMGDTSNLPELSPEDIGMVVTLRDDNLAVMFELTKADDIESVEYIIEYEAEIEDSIANQGVFGIMNIGKDGITKTDFREFGTCSAGRCRYDNVVSDITINLSVLKKDGVTYRVTEVVELDSSE